MRTVKMERGGESLITSKRGWPMRDTADGFIAHESDLGDVTATDLQAALRAYCKYMWGDPCGGEVDLAVADVPEEYLDDEAPPSGIAFSLNKGQLRLSLTVWLDDYLDEGYDDGEAEAYKESLTLMLERLGCELLHVGAHPNVGSAPPYFTEIHIRTPIRGKSLADMHAIGQDVLAFIDALQGGVLTRETAVSLLRAEKGDLLIGQPEGPWLDVKVDHYDLSGRTGKISLAQAVARFANAEHGGVIVVGMKAKKVPSGEIIKAVQPVPMDARMQRKYEIAIEQHLYPPPDYLNIELVPHGQGMLVVLSLPPQPEELKPFLVHGAIVDGSVEGAFISIVRRRGEASIPITAPSIHATMAAGRALLRRGEVRGLDDEN
ncbi:ATP-binding protein [Streptomyces viridochromogenes]|uniref:ATP-binding protein n=1 Tax=Streptomyces viridochromogenes TaxID=1938 RepID=UPI000AC766A8|nr:ATP-binding protein [Streptomyces viridochromogenes]